MNHAAWSQPLLHENGDSSHDLLSRFGNWRKSLWVTCVVLIAWFFSFSIVLILPLDISSVRLGLCCSHMFGSCNGLIHALSPPRQTIYRNCVKTWYCDERTCTTPVDMNVASAECADDDVRPLQMTFERRRSVLRGRSGSDDLEYVPLSNQA